MTLLGIPLADLALLGAGLLAAGVVTGVLAGLFGVGGGAVIVPVLYEVFRLLGVSEEVRMPLCVGTSLAVIVPTSIRSYRGHLAKGAVDTTVLRDWAVTIVVGVVLGSLVAAYAPPGLFKLVFVLVALATATKLLAGKESWRLADAPPRGPLMRAYGFVIGVLSSLMGIGGGQISNLVLGFYGVPIHRSVATSAGVGTLISIPGAIGYVLAGWGREGLPPGSLGFVSLLGFVLLTPTTVLAAPLGVRLAHAMPKRRLEIAFGAFLLVVAARFVASLLA